jgi:hypothetical protein
MEDKIQRLVNAANSTNAVAKEIGEKQLRELGLDNNGNPLKSTPTIQAKPKAERKKREPKAKVVSTTEKRESPDKEKDYKTYCDELISKADERKAKAKAAAAKRANEPKKTDATKNKETIEKAASRVEKNVEKRVKKDNISFGEIKKLIAEYEDAIAKLKVLLAKAEGKMAKGGGVDAEEVEHILMRAQGVKEHHCGCNDKKMKNGGSVYDKKESMLHFVTNELSSGMIANRTNVSDYKTIDAIRRSMVEMLEEHGDEKYSVSNLNKLIKDAEISVVGKSDRGYMSVGSKMYGTGGKLVRRNGREYPTGSAWKIEHSKRNKGEKWEQYADGGGVNYKKNWEVVYITLQGKMGKKTITLGRMSDKEDVKQALKRMDLNIREVTSIKEVK